MKENKLAKFMALVLLITLLAVILVSGTYAKYTTSASGTDTATVAKWSIKFGSEDIAKSQTKTLSIDLFSTITNTDGSLIAPGTMGKFTLAELKNESEVNAEYTVTYTLTNESGVPLEFTTTKDVEDSWNSDLSRINVAKTDLNMGATANTTPVYWRWAFDGNDDVKDTTLGTTTPTVTIKAEIKVEQKN